MLQLQSNNQDYAERISLFAPRSTTSHLTVLETDCCDTIGCIEVYARNLSTMLKIENSDVEANPQELSIILISL